MGSDLGEGWQADNKKKDKAGISKETKTPEKHRLHFSKEKRRGKTVTIVQPFSIEEKELKKLLKTLKSTLGTGGTVREDALEFQGECREKLKQTLEKIGYAFKH